MSPHKLLPVVSLFLLLAESDLCGQGAPYHNFWAYTDCRFPYDAYARSKRMAGSGVFRLQIDQKTGRVISVAALKSTGWTYLDEAAARTMMRWRARPNAPRSDVTVPITFSSSARSR
jgi:TonB family protein